MNDAGEYCVADSLEQLLEKTVHWLNKREKMYKKFVAKNPEESDSNIQDYLQEKCDYHSYCFEHDENGVKEEDDDNNEKEDGQDC